MQCLFIYHLLNVNLINLYKFNNSFHRNSYHVALLNSGFLIYVVVVDALYFFIFSLFITILYTRHYPILTQYIIWIMRDRLMVINTSDKPATWRHTYIPNFLSFYTWSTIQVIVIIKIGKKCDYGIKALFSKVYFISPS